MKYTLVVLARSGCTGTFVRGTRIYVTSSRYVIIPRLTLSGQHIRDDELPSWCFSLCTNDVERLGSGISEFQVRTSKFYCKFFTIL